MIMAAKRNVRPASPRLSFVTAAFVLVALCIGDGAGRPVTPKVTPKPTPTPTPTPRPPPRGILVTGQGFSSEPNVCDAAGRCGSSARVELQVVPSNASSTPVWAPLCAPDALNTTQRGSLAYIICNQFYEWPKPENWRTNPSNVYMVYGFPEEDALIPAKVAKGTNGTNGETLFRPANYQYWVTISGWGNKSADSVRYVQDLQLKVSRSSCSKKRMLSVFCGVITADGRRRHMLRH